MNEAIPETRPVGAATTVATDVERRAIRERRLDEAASIVAATLLEMWRREHGARAEATRGGAS